MGQDHDAPITKPITSLASSAAAGQRMSLLIYHRDGCTMVPLGPSRPSLVVGRVFPADVPLPDPSLSRQHARFTLLDDGVWVEDLGSTNGTLLNGKKVSRARVGETDVVVLGAVSVALHVLDPGASEAQGIGSYDAFLAKLSEELERARVLRRPFAVLMVGTRQRSKGDIGRFGARVRGMLRAVDLLAPYDSSSLAIGVVEAGGARAVELGRAIVEPHSASDPRLLCGAAVFPDQAASVDQLMLAARTALGRASDENPVHLAGAEGEPIEAIEDKPVTVDPLMREIYATARRIADAPIPLLIYGDTGTGKEVLARAIHEASSRRKGPFLCVNCGAIPAQLVESLFFGHERGAFTGADQQRKGVFEQGHGGTLLLDEVGELTGPAQVALLRVIETKRVTRVGSNRDFEVDIGIIAATHRDLEQMCGSGSFRRDLFFRLDVMVFRLSPLRERPDEILPLALRFMRTAARRNACSVRGIEAEAEKLLRRYPWPGNVRELRNVIERAVVITTEGVITVADLPERVRLGVAQQGPDQDAAALPSDLSIKERLRRYEAKLLRESLEAHGWNRTRTAGTLGMPFRTLMHRIKVLGLKQHKDGD